MDQKVPGKHWVTLGMEKTEGIGGGGGGWLLADGCASAGRGVDCG